MDIILLAEFFVLLIRQWRSGEDLETPYCEWGKRENRLFRAFYGFQFLFCFSSGLWPQEQGETAFSSFSFALPLSSSSVLAYWGDGKEQLSASWNRLKTIPDNLEHQMTSWTKGEVGSLNNRLFSKWERTTYCCTTPRHRPQKMPDQSAPDASYLQKNENTGLLKLSDQKLNFRVGLGGSSCTLTFRRCPGMAVATRTLTGPTDSHAPNLHPASPSVPLRDTFHLHSAGTTIRSQKHSSLTGGLNILQVELEDLQAEVGLFSYFLHS